MLILVSNRRRRLLQRAARLAKCAESEKALCGTVPLQIRASRQEGQTGQRIRPIKRSEARQRLASRGGFAPLEPAPASAVFDAGRIVASTRGTALFRPGDEPAGISGLVHDDMVISTTGRDGFPAAGHIMRRGAWFGYGSVTFRQKRTLMVKANEPSTILHVPLSRLDRLRSEHPALGPALAILAAHGETALLRVIADLLFGNTDRRLASVLLRMTDESQDDPWKDTRGMCLTQQRVADLSATSIHTVARFVERSNLQGCISSNHGRMRILDAGDLREIAAGRRKRTKQESTMGASDSIAATIEGQERIGAAQTCGFEADSAR